jgi:hypothetical protein
MKGNFLHLFTIINILTTYFACSQFEFDFRTGCKNEIIHMSSFKLASYQLAPKLSISTRFKIRHKDLVQTFYF